MRTVDPVMYRAKRQHIAQAASGLFAAKGFEATTTAEICKAAGMSSGAVFHYFASKREIFHAVFVDDDGETAEQLAVALGADDPWAGFLGFTDHLVAGSVEPHVPALVLEMMLHATRDPEFAQRLGDQDHDEEAGVAALLARAADAGQIDPGLDIGHAASWVMALVGGLYVRAATTDGFDPRAQLPTLRLLLTRFLRSGSPSSTDAAPPTTTGAPPR